jgi:hypothetical protein
MDSFTPVGKSRFLYYLNKVETILDNAATSENPALVAYKEDLRTPFFMLEALSRLYKKIYSHKKLTKLNEHFKDIEDALGGIDYYDGFYQQFLQQKNIPARITGFIKDQRDEKTQDLNDLLKEEKWIGKNKNRVSKIKKDLDQINWFDEKHDSQAILDVYQDDIDKVIKKYKVKKLEFKDVENDVHELRRRVRWLSIYPQALRGLMQLKQNVEPPDFLKKYLTPEVLNSPFNVLPDGSGLQSHIMLNNNYFYALSWIIAELGKLKDSGLKILLLEDSIDKVYKTKEDVRELAHSISGADQPTLEQILSQSQKIATTFFEENILQNLIA